ncbi:LysR family transcriptional regulator [Roseateles oligotrophus]|uniref:LysR family transcriptional regulator n=1 Tax=Roseateles oligotrophus TaxID=1769250 RepID=A0ABT2YCS4_9BURK|nr:LysR family transcriptional regulator [Roseateles oligotrophus]MCV2367850.1 LysR family transcriptional regulator [Roseateles oligotrophus]
MAITPSSWDDLRFFLHIGRAGSLTAAAGSLAVSHATVFRRLQRLEDEVGVRLFERSRAGYTLTAAGEELLRVAAEMELDLASATRRLGSRAAWPGGVVRLTTTDTLMHAALAPMLSAYQRAAGVQLLINTSTVQQDILKGEADVAIRAGGRPADPLVARRLCRIESTVYRSRKLGGVTPENLADFSWIAGDDTFAHLDSSKWLRQQGLDAQAVLLTNSHVNVLKLVMAGAGLAVLPCYLGDLEPSICRVIQAPPKMWRSDLWMLTRVELRQVPRIKQLFDAVYDGTRAMLPLFEGQAPIA